MAHRWSPVAFSPDGCYFLSISCEQAKIERWNITTKQVENSYPLSGIFCGTSSVATFSPDGERFLFSSGSDVLLWHVDSLRPLHRLLQRKVEPLHEEANKIT